MTARLARVRNGAVKRAELLDAGVSRHVVDRRVAQGELHRIHRGVYIAGHLALAPMAREAAALLACGRGALISHRSGLYLWSILSEQPREVDVTLVGRRCRPKTGVRIHLTSCIDQRDVRRKGAIVLTAPARTLIDFAAVADDDTELERAVSEARALRLVRDGEIEAALERAGKRAGVARMRHFLRSEGEHGFTRQESERRMRQLTRAAGLAQPLCNARLAGYEVDFLWPEQRLVIEVDGYTFHGHRGAFERDRKKDQVLLAAGYRVMRVTWRQLLYEPMRVAAAIASALAASRSHG